MIGWLVLAGGAAYLYLRARSSPSSVQAQQTPRLTPQAPAQSLPLPSSAQNPAAPFLPKETSDLLVGDIVTLRANEHFMPENLSFVSGMPAEMTRATRFLIIDVSSNRPIGKMSAEDIARLGLTGASGTDLNLWAIPLSEIIEVKRNGFTVF